MKKEKTNYILEPAKFRLDGGAMYGIIPRPMWSKVSPPDHENRIDLALRLWLMSWKDRLLLIDTGIGDYHHEKFNEQFCVSEDKDPLGQALKELGLKTSDVTDLLISHLHFDHVGGINTKDSNPVFPNATLYLHKQHYEYSKKATTRDRGSFHHKNYGPILEFYKKNNKVNWLEGESGVICEDLKFTCSHGHTPFLVHPYDEEYIYLADIVPTSNHVHIPWVMGYDIAPGQSTKDKERLLKFIAEKDLTIVFEHDPKFWGAKVQKNEKGRYVCSELKEASGAKTYSI